MLYLLLAKAIGEIIVPLVSENTFKTIRLPNSLEVTLSSCYTCTQGSVSIGVGVGSNQDLVPGLAHFVEHMLFYSSKTYPQEEYWIKFVNTHGGSINAFTDYHKTVYFFNIENSVLEESISIISRAFAEPIFSPEAAKLEVRAVQSEMEGGLYDEDMRLVTLVETLLGPSIIRSTIGNIESLKSDNITLYMQQFWEAYYKADNLKLCITGNYSVEQMEEWTHKYFSDLKDGSLETKNEIKRREPNFIVGEKIWDGEIGLIFWVVDSESWEYQEIDFLSYVMQYSMNKFINGSLNAGKYFEFKDQTIFMMQADFQNNLENPEYVFELMLGILEEMKTYTNETLFELWTDYKLISSNNFFYSDLLKSSNLATTISSNMLHYPEHLYYAGNSLKFSYSFEKLQSLLNHLTPESAFSALLTQNSGYVMDKYDEYYDMKYGESFKVFSPAPISITKLKKNPYVPRDIKLVMTKFTEELLQLEESPFVIWFKYNTHLKKPFVTVAFIITCEDWQISNHVAFIHAALVNEKFSRDYEYYGLAGYSFKIEIEYGGVSVQLRGWNSGIMDYFRKFLLCFFNTDSKRFEPIKSNLIKYKENVVKQSYEVAIQYLNKLITKSYLTDKEIVEKLRSTTKSDFVFFEKNLKYSRVEIFVFGNTHLPNMTFINQYFQPSQINRNLKKSLLVDEYAIFSARAINENAILNWYEYGILNSHIYSILKIIQIFFKDKAFSTLRSRYQLGYVATLGVSESFSSNALFLIVQGSSHSPKSMQSFIDSFWSEAKISESEFNLTKSTLKASLNPVYSFKELFEFNWKIILSPLLKEVTPKKIMKELENVSYSEVLQYLSYIANHRQELSIRLSVDELEPSIDESHFQY